jgi:hypothetical protein
VKFLGHTISGNGISVDPSKYRKWWIGNLQHQSFKSIVFLV